MNPRTSPLPGSALVLGLVLTTATPVLGRSLTLTVNSDRSDNAPDTRLTFVEALLVANGDLGRPLSAGESAAVEEAAAGSDLRIRFAIPGDGPHFLVAPPGGFPPLAPTAFAQTLVDGYSQPGARPNTRPLGSPNDAVLQVVLDCRVLTPGPGSEETPDWTLKIVASNTHLRGFSLLSGTESSTYGVYFSDGASGGQVSGCWFGLSPDQQILSGGEVALAAYGTAGGHVFGSNLDGTDDPAEINVIVAHAIGVQFEETRDIRVQHNLIGVMPDGRSLPPAAIRDALEGDALEGGDLAGTITVRRNLIGGMRGDVVEFYGSAERLVLVENHIGLAPDGSTPLPNGNFLRVREIQAVVGPAAVAGPDAVSGLGNVLAHHSGYLFRHSLPGTRILHRANRLVENTGVLSANLGNSLAGLRLGREVDLAPLLGADSTRALLRGGIPLAGPGAGGLSAAVIDLYQAEPGPDPEHPRILRWLAAFTEGGAADRDPGPGTFAFDLSGVAGLDEASHLAVTVTLEDASGSDTSPFSALLALPPAPPALGITRDGGAVVLQWGATGYGVQVTSGDPADPAGWTEAPGGSPLRFELPAAGNAFFRLKAR